MNVTDIDTTIVTTEDSELAARVADVVTKNTSLQAWGVWVTVAAGRVTLHGQVTGWGPRDAIEHAVHRIEGLKEIKNWMTVRPETLAREVGQAIVEAGCAPA